MSLAKHQGRHYRAPPTALVAGELGIAAIMVSVLIQILATLRLIITQAGQHFTTISNIWVLRWIASHLMH